MRRSFCLVTTCFALIAGCSSGAIASRSTEEPSASGSAPSARPTLVLQTPAPTKVPGGSTRYSGILSFDAIEGGCVYLQAADGRRLEVIYPEGWTIVKAPLALIRPDGSVHARSGDAVSVLGTEASDMASICQIGPIIRANEVIDR